MRLRSTPLLEDMVDQEGSYLVGEGTAAPDASAPSLPGTSQTPTHVIQAIFHVDSHPASESCVPPPLIQEGWKRGLEYTLTTKKIQSRINDHFVRKRNKSTNDLADLIVTSSQSSCTNEEGENFFPPSLSTDCLRPSELSPLKAPENRLRDAQERRTSFLQGIPLTASENTLTALSFVLNSLVSVFELLKTEVQTQAGVLLELANEVSKNESTTTALNNIMNTILIRTIKDSQIEGVKQGLDLTQIYCLLKEEAKNNLITQELVKNLPLVIQEIISKNQLQIEEDPIDCFDDTPLSNSVLEEFRRLANVDLEGIEEIPESPINIIVANIQVSPHNETISDPATPCYSRRRRNQQKKKPTAKDSCSHLQSEKTQKKSKNQKNRTQKKFGTNAFLKKITLSKEKTSDLEAEIPSVAGPSQSENQSSSRPTTRGQGKNGKKEVSVKAGEAQINIKVQTSNMAIETEPISPVSGISNYQSPKAAQMNIKLAPIFLKNKTQKDTISCAALQKSSSNTRPAPACLNAIAKPAVEIPTVAFFQPRPILDNVLTRPMLNEAVCRNGLGKSSSLELRSHIRVVEDELEGPLLSTPARATEPEIVDFSIPRIWLRLERPNRYTSLCRSVLLTEIRKNYNLFLFSSDDIEYVKFPAANDKFLVEVGLVSRRAHQAIIRNKIDLARSGLLVFEREEEDRARNYSSIFTNREVSPSFGGPAGPVTEHSRIPTPGLKLNENLITKLPEIISQILLKLGEEQNSL
ncbi:uncharacterized protein [Ambystoma mexicanum]|uniref:uncharacterized protein n=1 Tax=Ambystoma mexicanum TaxID=8296 RepID=UPI0037E7C8E6